MTETWKWLGAVIALSMPLEVHGYGRYYDDCKEFIKNFDTNCGSNYAVGDISTASGTEMTCEGPNACVGTSTYDANPVWQCTHQSTLCVTCTSTDLYDQYADTYIRVQTNSMPKMCWSIPKDSGFQVDYKYWDWQVIFNPNVFGAYNVQPSTISNDATRDTYLCDQTVTKSANVPSSSSLSFTSGYSDISNAVGVTIKNQLIFNAITSENGDVNLLETEFYSMTYNDNCMMHAWDGNVLSMTLLSNCLSGDFASTSTAPNICKENWLYGSYRYGSSANKPFCDDMTTMEYYYSMNFTDTSNYGGIYGIAKDGHIIYGPYNKHNELWECNDLDVCNGHWLEDGSYGYGMTPFFPYTIGCWGPAPYPALTAAGCSRTACTGGALSGLVLNSASLLVFFSMLIFNLF